MRSHEKMKKTIKKIEMLTSQIRTMHEQMQATDVRPLFVGGMWRSTKEFSVLYDYKGGFLGKISQVNESMVDLALHTSLSRMLKGSEKKAILKKVSKLLLKKKEKIARQYSLESGIPLKHTLEMVDKGLLEGFEDLIPNLKGEVIEEEGKVETRQRCPLAKNSIRIPWYDVVRSMICCVSTGIVCSTPITILAPLKGVLTCIEILKVFLEAGMPVENVSLLLEDDSIPAKRIGLEGKTAFFVLRDTILEDVAQEIVDWISRSIYPAVIFVDVDVVTPLLEIIKQKIGRLICGDPLNLKTDVWTYDAGMLGSLRNQKTSIVKSPTYGGKFVSSHFTPCVYMTGSFNNRLIEGVKIGPVLILVENIALKDTLRFAKKYRFANVVVYTGDIEHAFMIAKQVDTNQVFINCMPKPWPDMYVDLVTKKRRIVLATD